MRLISTVVVIILMLCAVGCSGGGGGIAAKVGVTQSWDDNLEHLIYHPPTGYTDDLPRPPTGYTDDLPRPTAPATGATLANERVYVTNTGEKYHKAGCRYLLSVSQSFSSYAEAEKAGYTACKNCF